MVYCGSAIDSSDHRKILSISRQYLKNSLKHLLACNAFSVLGIVEKNALLPMTINLCLALVIATLNLLGLFRKSLVVWSGSEVVNAKRIASLSAP